VLRQSHRNNIRAPFLKYTTTETAVLKKGDGRRKNSYGTEPMISWWWDTFSTAVPKSANAQEQLSFHLFNDVDPATNGADDDVVVVGQLGKLTGLQHVLVELVVVDHWKDNLEQAQRSAWWPISNEGLIMSFKTDVATSRKHLDRCTFEQKNDVKNFVGFFAQFKSSLILTPVSSLPQNNLTTPT